MRLARSSARVLRRRGMASPLLRAGGVPVTVTGAVGALRLGKSSLLPGVVVWVRPSGAVQCWVPGRGRLSSAL
jgi:hypothetical protein